MIAKIVKGQGFRGVVNYVLDEKKGTELLCSDGIRTKDHESIIRSFLSQAELNNRVSKPVYHISLDFSVNDKAKLTNDVMVEIARTYIKQMKLEGTQFLIARHYDKEHPHIHLILNRVNFDGKTISDKNDRVRSEKVCKELTAQYHLYFAKGKEKVNVHRLKEPDKTRYKIYEALKETIPECKNWGELEQKLQQQGITINYKYKGKTNEIQGILFRKNDLIFSGSKVDRQFSYSKIDYQLHCYSHKHSNSLREPLDKNSFSTLRTGMQLLKTDLTDCNQRSERERRQQIRIKSKKRNPGLKL
nr:relaxase/mobilization nuclease domain-containing protein [uncultured Carboxylicivirga sp.]